MIVLDNSALVEATTGQRPPPELLDDLARLELHVPHLLDYEFRSALRGLLLGGRISPVRGEGALLVKESLSFLRYPESVTGPRAWDLRDHLNPYDASYVALAEQLQCPLATTDATLERQVRTVELRLYR
ncbi:type II toxin-antitoxin system VapC family toxin [Glycomyces sp. TRM65418]|uniref:type II toxin-antitoxin system VapC family toxin n=1 Tax=Glycomyces sp. TRM65418 TaxID=2867006 RepID=UPI001CE5ABBD|nr:type II toxin-antitoxin system VapC family toxin [Glycomyces sp. TRM65418]MCC3764046.1 type II toxin-antitoxin system VapC family toxin [Glycomyces sp. TRM65418]QZD53737.1 type II toxin-antitoxin system VapC family toxin [Glycomyces sp. TRM65418]